LHKIVQSNTGFVEETRERKIPTFVEAFVKSAVLCVRYETTGRDLWHEELKHCFFEDSIKLKKCTWLHRSHPGSFQWKHFPATAPKGAFFVSYHYGCQNQHWRSPGIIWESRH